MLTCSTDTDFNMEAPWSSEADFANNQGLTEIPESLILQLFGPDKIPEGSYIHAVVQRQEAQTESSIVFGMGSALATLAGIAGRDLDCSIFPGATSMGNIWVLLVGDSAMARKSTAVALATKGLKEGREFKGGIEQHFPTLIMGKPGSAQGMLKHLAESPICLIVQVEFGDFVVAAGAKSGGSSFYGQVKPALMKFFDGQSEIVAYAGEQIRVEDPRLSMLAGCAPSLLEAHSDPQDWDGGFYSRFLMLYGGTERSVYKSNRPEARKWSAECDRILARFAERTEDGTAKVQQWPCEDLSPEAEHLWRTYNQIIRARYKVFAGNQAICSMMGRVTTHVSKVALLLAMNRGCSEEPGWTLDGREMALAIRIVDRMHLRSVIPLVDRCQNTGDARLKAACKSVIGNRVRISLGDLTAATGQLANRIAQVMDTLAHENYVTIRQDGPTVVYTRVIKTEESMATDNPTLTRLLNRARQVPSGEST